MLVKCSICGKFFGAESSEETVCSSCNTGPRHKYSDIEDEDMKRFKAARDTVYDHPDISPQDLVDVLDEMGIEITTKEIMSYVKEGRLTLKNNPDSRYCEDCGRVITGGRLCIKCSNQLEKSITQRNTTTKVVSTVVIDNEKERKGMHTAENLRKK